MQRYQDYATLMLGGPRAENLVPAPELLTPQQRAGVPDIQLEVFSDVREQFDCMSLGTLPFDQATPNFIKATSVFKQKYLLMVCPLLAAHSSAGRRVQFFRLAEHLLGPGFEGSNKNMEKLIDAILSNDAQTVQGWMGIAPGKGRYGGFIKSAAQYIRNNSGPNDLIPPPPDGPHGLITAVGGMGMKTACLFFRWMTEPAPDLNLWGAEHRSFIPVDRRILQTCRNASDALNVQGNYNLNGSVNTRLFEQVTQFVSTGLGFGNTYLRADYPFWGMANSGRGQVLPICYQRINALDAACPLLRNGHSPDPRCYHCNCLFTG